MSKFLKNYLLPINLLPGPYDLLHLPVVTEGRIIQHNLLQKLNKFIW